MWKEIDWGDGYITYPEDLPNYLYRYRSINMQSIDRLMDFELCDEAIYLAGLNELNDPNEGRFLVRFSENVSDIKSFFFESMEDEYPNISQRRIEAEKRALRVVLSEFKPTPEIIKDYRDKIGQVFRVACFTEDCFNTPMWANYAKFIDKEKTIDRAGLCIEYRVDEGFKSLNLHPVDYTDSVPIVRVDKDIEDFSNKIFYVKHTSWSYEKEWRISSVLQATYPFEKLLTTNSKLRLESSINAIIFGEYTPSSIIKKIFEKVNNANPSIEFKQVFYDDNLQELSVKGINLSKM